MPQAETPGPIFIVGASRSGTTMLSACVNACTEVHMAEETHFFEDLRPRLERLRQEKSPEELRQIVENYFLTLTHRYYGQDGDPERGWMKREALRAEAERLGGEPDHYLEAFCLLSAKRREKQRWGEKTPRHVLRVDEILERYPNARIVCMIRDGRAVVTSYRDFKKGEIEEDDQDPGRKEALEAEQERVRKSYHVIVASLVWRGVARASQEALRKHGSERVYVQRYEDLVADAPGQLEAMCTWLDIPFDSAKLSTVPIGTSSYANKVQSDVGVSTEAVMRWRKKMSDAEVHAVERTSGQQLEDFGYELLRPPVSLWGRCRPWLTLPGAVFTAVRANAGRHGGVRSFLMRRLRALR